MTLRLLLLALVLLANALLFALGQGWLGTTPLDAGRDPARLQQQINAQAVRLAPMP